VRQQKFLAKFALVATASLILSACGGGGGGGSASAGGTSGSGSGSGSGTPPPEPFGLTERAPLAPIRLPTDPVGIGSYQLQVSFPNLGGFSEALFIAGVPGQDRMVVVQQTGQIRAFANDPGVSSSRLVLDISSQITAGGEEGLLGLAFDPDFVQNGYLYVHYSAASPRRSVISRFTWSTQQDLITPASEKNILEVNQPFSNHNAGMLAFGPDGYLYIAFGDGGSGGDPQNNAQTPANLLGSLLRIDVSPQNPADAYDVPPDNPFVGQSGFRPETWAYGLRNPFRFSFDRQTGDLWLGDVGQGEREEVNLVRGGENFGWRVYEGNLPFDDSQNSLPDSAFTPPVIDYDHGQGVSVIGGYVYRGPSNPGLVGRYLYTDFLSGPVWALDYDGSQAVANDVIVTSSSSTKSFGEDNDGEVYMLVGTTINQFVETASGGGDIPDQLSETGLFTSLNSLTPASGLIEYELNLPFWSDGALKKRFIALPDGARITFSRPWQFPVGALLIKHFELELTEGVASSARRLETRLLVRLESGWQGFTYRWLPDESDAVLLNSRETETITVALPGGGSRAQIYEYPSPTDCLVCHNDAAGFALGVNVLQLNRDFPYPAATDNQLRSWNHIQLFDRDIGDADQYRRLSALGDDSASLEDRARAYLQVNCASCHQPGGPAPTALDLRIDTVLADTGALDESPSAGDLGLDDPRIIAPGDHLRSVLWQRMTRLDGNRMPPIGSHVVDEVAVALIGDWIDTL
jgi:uncharacterized repeat protein (TIGR03806 family)